MNTIGKLLLLTAVCLASSSAQAQEDAHSHGEASLMVALAGNEVTASFEIAGEDAVGFEAAPNSAEQSAQLEQITALLAQSLEIFQFDEAANCSQRDADVQIEGYEGGEEHHAGFNVDYSLACGSQPTSVTVTAFEAFDALEAVDVQIVGAPQPISAEADPTSRSLSW